MIALLTPISLAGAIEQRAARVAGIYRRVGLDHAADLVGGGGRQPAPDRADDPRGQRLLQPIRVADRESGLSDLQICRTADRDRVQRGARAVEAQHREIVIRRGPDDIGLDEFAPRQPRSDPAGAADHVIVGDDVPGRVPHDPRPGLHGALLRLELKDAALGRRREDMHDRGRGRLEQVDRRGLVLGEAAARRDGARLGGRPPQRHRVGLQDPDRRQNQRPEDREAQQEICSHAIPIRLVSVLAITVPARPGPAPDKRRPVRAVCCAVTISARQAILLSQSFLQRTHVLERRLARSRRSGCRLGRAAPAARDRRGDGRGDAAHRLFADPQFEPRLLDRDLRPRRQADRAGRARADPCRRAAVRGEGDDRVLPWRHKSRRRLSAQRPVSRRQSPARPDRLRADIRGGASRASGRSTGRIRAISAARRTAPTTPRRPTSGRKASASRP